MAIAELAGVSIVYDRFGDGDPVVLVPGLGMPALLWHDTLVPPLVAAGYEVITFDNRGVPPSDCPPNPYALDDLVGDAVALIEHLGLGPVRLLGYSMGGCIAQELALARPDLVRGVVLVGTRGRHNVFTRASIAGQIALFRDSPDTPVEFFVPFLLGSLLSLDQLLDDAVVESFLEPMLAAPAWTDPGRLGQYEAYLAYDDRLASLAALTPPCQVIAFADDALVPASLGREVADAIPHASFGLIEHQGHYGVLLAVDALMSFVGPFFGGL